MKINDKDISGILDEIRSRPDASKMGMVATHLGIVRESSRDGRMVRGVRVKYDHEVLKNIVNDIKKMAGIIEVVVEANEGDLEIGDPIMFVAVGGDIRENVFPALIETVDRIKKQASRKEEDFL